MLCVITVVLSGAGNCSICGNRREFRVLPHAAALHVEYPADLLAGVTVVGGTSRRQLQTGTEEHVRLFAVPYAAWENREVGEMDVWLPEEFESDREALVIGRNSRISPVLARRRTEISWC